MTSFPASEMRPKKHTRRDSITDIGLSHFQRAYRARGEGSSITKEDLFYYIRGQPHAVD